MSAQHPSMRRRAARHRGFTLIELMIAMILGLIVIAGVTSIFLAGQQSYRTNNALGEVESSSRIAFELMARDIREAGLAGCDTSSGRVANVLSNSSTAWWANWANAVHGYGGANSNAVDGDSDQTDPGVTTGTATGNRVAGTDSLQLIGANSLPVTIASDTEPAGTFTLNEASDSLQAGDIAVICSPDHAALFQLGTYVAGSTTATHTNGSGSPGNCSQGLGYPSTCTTTGNVYTFPPNSSITKLAASDWYIGYNGESGSGKSLYREALVNNAGAVTTSAQEMVRNVTDMQVTYLQGAGPSFVAASAVTNWGDVKAARVTFTVESNFGRASAKGDKPIVRIYSATTTVRNRVN